MTWEAKAPAETRIYRWTPDLPNSDGISSASASVDSGTVTIGTVTIDYGAVLVPVSGGADGETARITITAISGDGRTLTETRYIAVREGAADLSETVRDVCDFALRKIIGNGETADADELTDAIERLEMMLLAWRNDGLDVGHHAGLAENTVLAVPDEYLPAIKYSLRVECHEHYGVPLALTDMRAAEAAKANLATRLLGLGDMEFEAALTRRGSGTRI